MLLLVDRYRILMRMPLNVTVHCVALAMATIQKLTYVKKVTYINSLFAWHA